MRLPSLMNLAVEIGIDGASDGCGWVGYHHPLSGQCSPVRTAVKSKGEGALVARRLGYSWRRGCCITTVLLLSESPALYFCRFSCWSTA